MNKKTLVMALSFCAVAAQAQVILAPDASLSKFLHTDQGLSNNSSLLGPAGKGLGFDASNHGNKFTGATTKATARSWYNTLVWQKNSTNVNGVNNLGVGAKMQIGVRAMAINRVSPGTAVSVYVSMFEFDGYDAANTQINFGKAVFTDKKVDISHSSVGANVYNQNLFFSGVFTTQTAMVPGKRYVLAFAPSADAGSDTPSNFAMLYQRRFSDQSLNSADESTFKAQYIQSNNGADNGDALLQGGATDPLAYQIYAVPEPGTMAAVAIGVAAMMRRRKRA